MVNDSGSVTDEVLAADVGAVAKRLGRDTLSRAEYLQHGRFSGYQLYDGGRTWEGLCKLAGIASKRIEAVPDDVYFERLASAARQLGRLPNVSERKKFGLNFSKRRYPTLKAFIDQAVKLGRLSPATGRTARGRPESKHVAPPPPSHRPEPPTSRPVPPIPLQTTRKKWERTGIDGFPYAPQDELGVVALFGILCSSGRIGWQILELRGGKGIDVTCFDHVMAREIRVELKHTLSRASWNHNVEDLDYVVCWENRWPDFPKPVVVLRELLEEPQRGA